MIPSRGNIALLLYVLEGTHFEATLVLRSGSFLLTDDSFPKLCEPSTDDVSKAGSTSCLPLQRGQPDVLLPSDASAPGSLVHPVPSPSSLLFFFLFSLPPPPPAIRHLPSSSSHPFSSFHLHSLHLLRPTQSRNTVNTLCQSHILFLPQVFTTAQPSLVLEMRINASLGAVAAVGLLGRSVAAPPP